MPAEPAFEPVIGAGKQIRLRDGEIARIAERQYGVVARRQLTELGVGRRAIGHRIECGRLHVIHPGVYAVGHRRLSREGHLMAAVFAGGNEALLGHRAAAVHWGVLSYLPNRIEVTVPQWRRPRPGLRFHQAFIPPDERTVHDCIPATTVPRTLLDLSAVLDPDGLERAIEQAEILRLTDSLSLRDLVDRHPGRRGVAKLRLVLADAQLGANVTRSALEDRFLSFLAERGLSRPEMNASIHAGGRWYEVDCLWRVARLVVELDGYATHGTRAAFERDRARTRALQVAGWRVVQVTWRQLHREPGELARELRALLSDEPPARGPAR